MARTLAREHRVELSGLVGTGPDGRIERRDVQEVIDRQGSAGSATPGSATPGSATPGSTTAAPTTAGSAAGAAGEEPVPPHRQVIARRLARAALVPHFSISKTVDATAMRRLAGRAGGPDNHPLVAAGRVRRPARAPCARPYLERSGPVLPAPRPGRCRRSSGDRRQPDRGESAMPGQPQPAGPGAHRAASRQRWPGRAG